MLLEDEHMTGTVQRQAALSLWRFGRNKPHVRPSDRLTDRLGSVASFLCRFTCGFTYAGGNNSVAERLEFARPMVRRSTGFDTD
jgi:hypothetical protein